MKFFLRALLMFAALVVGIGLLLPRQVHVERSITIDAPPATVFSLIDGFKQFNKWSPWVAKDPQTQYTYSGPATGVGAKMAWTSKKGEVGNGSQTIVESVPYDHMAVEMDFGGGNKAKARFQLVSEGAGTKVTWTMDSDMGANPIAHYFGMMIPGAVGRDYDQGLASLKKLAEALPKVDFSGLTVEVVDAQPVSVAYLPATSSKDPQAIAAAIGGAYGQIGVFLKANGLNMTGAPMTINTKWDDTGYGFEAAIPIDHLPVSRLPADSPVQVKQTYAGTALKVTHVGSYANMQGTYDKLMAYAAARGYELNGPPWDVYVSDPGNTPENEVKTEIYLPVK